jgi:excisionase family DNA binding protein
MQPLAVDVREAARLTSLSTRTIRRYIKPDGPIRAVRCGRRVLVSLESLQDLLRRSDTPKEERGTTHVE